MEESSEIYSPILKREEEFMALRCKLSSSKEPLREYVYKEINKILNRLISEGIDVFDLECRISILTQGLLISNIEQTTQTEIIAKLWEILTHYPNLNPHSPLSVLHSLFDSFKVSVVKGREIIGKLAKSQSMAQALQLKKWFIRASISLAKFALSRQAEYCKLSSHQAIAHAYATGLIKTKEIEDIYPTIIGNQIIQKLYEHKSRVNYPLLQEFGENSESILGKTVYTEGGKQLIYLGDEMKEREKLMKSLSKKKAKSKLKGFLDDYSLLILPETRIHYFTDKEDFMTNYSTKFFNDIAYFSQKLTEFDKVRMFNIYFQCLSQYIEFAKPDTNKQDLVFKKLSEEKKNESGNKEKLNMGRISEAVRIILDGGKVDIFDYLSPDNLAFDEDLDLENSHPLMLTETELFRILNSFRKWHREEDMNKVQSACENIGRHIVNDKYENQSVKDYLERELYKFENYYDAKTYLNLIYLLKKIRNIIIEQDLADPFDNMDFVSFEGVAREYINRTGYILIPTKDIFSKGFEEGDERKGAQEGELELGVNYTLQEIDAWLATNQDKIDFSFQKFNKYCKDIYFAEGELDQLQWNKFKQTMTSVEDLVKSIPEFRNEKVIVKPFGSVSQTFWTKNSDVDIDLIFPEQLNANPRMLPVKILQLLSNKLRRHIRDVHLVPSIRKPLLRYVDPDTGIDIDLVINSILGSINSNLINMYARYDERFRILGFFIKKWAKMRGIHGGDKGLLTSYCLQLMLINYLQQTDPPVLPNLQEIPEEGRKPKTDIYFPTLEYSEYDLAYNPKTTGEKIAQLNKANIELHKTNGYYEHDLQKVKNRMIKQYGASYPNQQSLGELAAGFFRQYAYHFQSGKQMVSIKDGKWIELENILNNDEHKYLFSVKDPFDTMHNPGKTCFKEDKKEEVIRNFKLTYLSLIQKFRPLIAKKSTKQLVKIVNMNCIQ